MAEATFEHIRKRIFDMLGQHDKKVVLAHFLTENIPCSTIYRTFKRYENGEDPEKRAKSGRPPIMSTKMM